MHHTDADLSSVSSENDLPDGTPIHVVEWRGSVAIVKVDAGNGHLRTRAISRARALELRGQADAEQLGAFVGRCHRSAQVGRERYREAMLARVRCAPRARQSRGATSRRRGSRRTVSRAGPGGGDPDPGEPEPPSRRQPCPDLSPAGGRP
jgi:hypothetical protein